MELNARDYQLIEAIQGGLPLCPQPYAEIGRRLGLSEDEVITRLHALLASGAIRRLGVVVRHHELGYRANAMVVWDVPDHDVVALGRRLGSAAGVTLCYRRPRRPPDWPYNLFCMIHGRDREAVMARIHELVREFGIQALPRAVLFSGRRYKQRGAWYAGTAVPARAAGSR